MKKVFISLILSFNIYGEDTPNYEIVCQNQASSATTKTLPFIFDSLPYYNIYSGTYVEGALDTVNNYIYFWDENSAVCGGSLNENRMIEAFCDDSINSSCWDVLVGKSGIEIITKNSENGNFYNNVNYVNGYPCLPPQTSSFTIGLYSANSGNDYEIPFQNANLNTFNVSSVQTLTQEEGNMYRSICSPTTAPTSDYSQQLNQLIENTSENKNIKELNERDKQLNQNLENYINTLQNTDTTETDLLEFETTFQTTLNNSFSNYSNIFGFGGFGPTPSPISFNMFGKSYDLFNVSILNEYIDLIRTTFIIFAYLWGIIIVFRSI